MGKRSEFQRRPQDKYYTPHEGIIPLLPFLPRRTNFFEPCAGNGQLIRALEAHGHYCTGSCDIEPDDVRVGQRSAFDISLQDNGAAMIITNPPWTRPILHQLIEYLPTMKPTWLLFDADWMHTRQSATLIKTCEKIVSVGRLKWIEDSPSVGKDNCAWHYFPGYHTAGPTFYGRTLKSGSDKTDAAT